MGLLLGARTLAERDEAGQIARRRVRLSINLATTLLSDAYVTLGHCVQNSLTLP